jgi:hypothetical protein
MMTDQIFFAARKSRLPIALVALSIAFGAPAVHAQSDENAASWREIADPVINAVHSLEARFASIEASVAQFASSFTTQQVNTRELCVLDETGAQTCLTKAQLDALLAKMTQAAVEVTAEPPAARAEAPAVAVVEAPAVATEPQDSANAKPAAANATAVATAPVVEPGAGSKEEQSADVQSTAGDTPVVSSPEPAANPAEPVGRDDESRDHEPATTSSVTTEPSHDAVVSYPEVDISAAKTSSANE